MCRHAWLLTAVVALPLLAGAAEVEPYSPYADQTHATRVFWGDTHLHSSWSRTPVPAATPS